MKKEFSDRVEYYNEQGELHRLDGPAIVWHDGKKEWYQNDQLHRLDGPAVEEANGTKKWYQNGQRHRLNGPAIEYLDGTKYWLHKGLLHREDGPAIERANGMKEWYQNGQRHRLDGPAIETNDGTKSFYIKGKRLTPEEFEATTIVKDTTNNPIIETTNGTKKWFQDGKLHRLDGPAVECDDGEKQWYQHGKLHREDGPAVEFHDGSKYWYQNGRLHRLDGPAVEEANGNKEYWINGKKVNINIFKKIQKGEKVISCKKCGNLSEKKICDSCSYNKRISNPANVKVWTKVFLSLGYTFLHDPGMSILHNNEPSQGCALASMGMDLIDVFENPLTLKKEKEIVLKPNIKSKTLETFINQALKNKQDSFFKNEMDLSRLSRETIFKIIDSAMFLETCDNYDFPWGANFSKITDPEIILKLFAFEMNLDVYTFKYLIINKFDIIKNLISIEDLKLFTKQSRDIIPMRALIEKIGMTEFIKYCINEKVSVEKFRDTDDKHKIINYWLEHSLSHKLIGIQDLIASMDVPFVVKIFQKYKQSIIKNNVLSTFITRLPSPILTQLLKEEISLNVKALINSDINDKKYNSKYALLNESYFQDYNLARFYYEDDILLERAEKLGVPLKRYIKYLSPQGLIKAKAHLSSEKKIRGYAAEHLDLTDLHLLARDKSPWIRSIVARRCPLDMLSLFKGDKHPVIQEVIGNRLASFSSQIVKTAEESQKELNQVADTLLEYAEEPYHYIHFTEDYSLRGLNPKYQFGNPIGIYGYPLDHKMVSDFRNNRIPYGSNRKFFILFKARNPETVLDFKEYQMSQLYYDCHKIVSLFKISEDEMLNLIEDSEFLALNNSPGGRFYYITMMVAGKLPS